MYKSVKGKFLFAVEILTELRFGIVIVAGATRNVYTFAEETRISNKGSPRILGTHAINNNQSTLYLELVYYIHYYIFLLKRVSENN